MSKPFVVIETKDIRVTDLLNGTSEILLKGTGNKYIYTDQQMRDLCRSVWGDKYVDSIKHRVGATRDYDE